MITQPHGVSGRVKLKLFTENLKPYVSQLTLASGEAVELRLTGEAGGSPVAEISSIKNRNEADLWRGRELGVKREALRPLSNDALYVHDMVGLAVLNMQGETMGTVMDVANFGASDIIVIRSLDGNEQMHAFTAENFPEINIAAGYMRCQPPETIGGDTREAS